MKYRKTVLFVAIFSWLHLLSTSVFAVENDLTDGGEYGKLRIYYDLSISGSTAYASTIAYQYEPNPNLSTYVEARYYDVGSNTYRLKTASGSTSATSYTPNTVVEAKSVHTANSKEWGYFRATLIRP
jgi:hypothetical protein